MLVTLFGIFTLASALQSKNAKLLILVTLSGIVTLVSALQPANNLYPILVTPLPIVTCMILSRTFASVQSIPLIKFISPVPEIVINPLLSRVQCRLSPHCTVLVVSVAVSLYTVPAEFFSLQRN